MLTNVSALSVMKVPSRALTAAAKLSKKERCICAGAHGGSLTFFEPVKRPLHNELGKDGFIVNFSIPLAILILTVSLST